MGKYHNLRLNGGLSVLLFARLTSRRTTLSHIVFLAQVVLHAWGRTTWGGRGQSIWGSHSHPAGR